MKEKLGTYQMGIRVVDVYTNKEETGGWFSSIGHNGQAEITIGLNYTDWSRVLSVLMHETLELACSDLNLRFKPAVDFADASDGYLFMMDHSSFSEAIARSSHLLTFAIPDLASKFQEELSTATKNNRRRK